MRLIDADALADDLLYDAELCARALDDTDIVGKERERLQWEKDCKQNCVFYLTESPTIDAVPAWIPVTERLPEIDMSYPHHEDYLVQYDSGNMDVASWSNVNRFWTDHVTEPHWNCVQFAEVIAWMPLPKPWKE